MTGEDLRTRYFDAMRAADLDAVLALFDEQAVVILPDGREHAGRPALAQLYTGILQAARPTPAPGAMTGSDGYWAVEVATRLPDGRSRHTANFFRVNDRGLIARMHSYARA